MGAKFNHTHVRSDDVAAVVRALSELARAHQLSVAADGQPCDYEVLVAADSASPGWTSIYKPFAEVWELSGILATYVVELEVFDSDVLYARATHAGNLVDVFCNEPEYVGESARTVKGRPKRWEGLCVPGKTWRDVQRVFKAAADNPELALVELGKIVGLDERSLYPDHLDPAGPGVHRLRFRSPPPRRLRILRSAPVATMSAAGAWPIGGPAVPITRTEENVLLLSTSAGSGRMRSVVSSQGGGSNGIEIAFHGTALASGLIAIEALTYRYEAGAITPAADSWLVASFPKSGFPAASGWVEDETQTEPRVASQRPSVDIEFDLTPLRAGEGELEIRVTPIDPHGELCKGHMFIRVTS